MAPHRLACPTGGGRTDILRPAKQSQYAEDIVAQKTVVELVDDLDGGEADETVVFALDGIDFTIDLSADNANRLRDTLAEYVGRARRTDSRKGGRATLHSVDTKLDTQAVREWARSQGENVAERGRLSHDLVIRFQAAHS